MKTVKKVLGAILTEFNNEFFIMKENRVFKVNESAARIFELCNNTDPKSIAKKINSYYKEDNHQQIEIDVIECIYELEEMGLVRTSD